MPRRHAIITLLFRRAIRNTIVIIRFFFFSCHAAAMRVAALRARVKARAQQR